ncbi:hypothetical protein O181_030944 [Austropuccinia psidii MF-1]|uniref:Uncharacterized protein n=1 Tax=Austropuccinia psidii MF-1 TaxID=1389203 RepID=A0A9Q3H615_9BASI|nr:hypothetical protein [Austropuccinia psidii MF-1]
MDTHYDSSGEDYDSQDDYNVNVDIPNNLDHDMPPQSTIRTCKHHGKQPDVYDYFEKLMETGVWVAKKSEYCFTYKCWHCSVKIGVMGYNTSNMNKH